MADEVKVSVDFLNDVVVLAEKAAGLEKGAEAIKEAAPKVVEMMISSKLVNPSQRDEFIERMTTDPTCVFNTLGKVAALAAKPREMGSGEEKSSEVTPYDGTGTRPSDTVFENAFSG